MDEFNGPWALTLLLKGRPSPGSPCVAAAAEAVADCRGAFLLLSLSVRLSLSVFSSACLLGDGFDEQDDVLVVGASSGAVLAAYGRSGVLPVASRVSRVSFLCRLNWKRGPMTLR